MKTFKISCGCEIHVIKWSAKANSITMQNCPVHKYAPDLLKALKNVYDEAIEYGHEAIFDADEIAAAIAKAEGR